MSKPMKYWRDFMKKSFIAAALCLTAFSVPLVGCERKSAELTSKSEIVEFQGDNYDYSGTFNEEVFDNLSQNINLKGVKVSMPCTLYDLGECFKIALPQVDTRSKYTAYTLYYNDISVGKILYESDHELIENELKTQKFVHLYIKPADLTQEDISVAGIKIGDDYNKAEKLFGSATSGEYDGKNGNNIYDISKYKWLAFDVEDGKITQIIIRSKENKPDNA